MDWANNYELILWFLSTDWLCRQIDRYAWFKHVLYESQNVWRYLLSSLCKIQTLGGKFELCLQSETRFNIYSGWVIIHEAFDNCFLNPKNWFAKTWTRQQCSDPRLATRITEVNVCLVFFRLSAYYHLSLRMVTSGWCLIWLGHKVAWRYRSI